MGNVTEWVKPVFTGEKGAVPHHEAGTPPPATVSGGPQGSQCVMCCAHSCGVGGGLTFSSWSLSLSHWKDKENKRIRVSAKGE